MLLPTQAFFSRIEELLSKKMLPALASEMINSLSGKSVSGSLLHALHVFLFLHYRQDAYGHCLPLNFLMLELESNTNANKCRHKVKKIKEVDV